MSSSFVFVFVLGAMTRSDGIRWKGIGRLAGDVSFV